MSVDSHNLMKVVMKKSFWSKIYEKNQFGPRTWARSCLLKIMAHRIIHVSNIARTSIRFFFERHIYQLLIDSANLNVHNNNIMELSIQRRRAPQNTHTCTKQRWYKHLDHEEIHKKFNPLPYNTKFVSLKFPITIILKIQNNENRA